MGSTPKAGDLGILGAHYPKGVGFAIEPLHRGGLRLPNLSYLWDLSEYFGDQYSGPYVYSRCKDTYTSAKGNPGGWIREGSGMHPTSWRTRVNSRSGPPLRPTAPNCGPVYRRRRPTQTPLYPLVQHHLETFLTEAAEADPMGGSVPSWVERDFRAYLRCGILAHGFARARCAGCGYDFLVAFSCKGRGVCPSCNARRMVETAAHLVDHVLPPLPVRPRVGRTFKQQVFLCVLMCAQVRDQGIYPFSR